LAKGPETTPTRGSGVLPGVVVASSRRGRWVRRAAGGGGVASLSPPGATAGGWRPDPFRIASRRAHRVRGGFELCR
jgi:hypothetical protein